jgi:hypothetical protein
MIFASVIYKTPVFIPHRQKKNSVSIIKIVCLRLLKQVIAVNGDVYTKHLSPVYEQNAKYHNVTKNCIRN